MSVASISHFLLVTSKSASIGKLLFKESRVSCDEGMQFARYAIEMVRHFAFCLIWLMSGNRAKDRFVLAEGSLGSSRLRQQRSTDSLKMGSDRIEDLANSCETQAFGHLAMKPGV
jgi:hypothetical protein